MTVIGEPHRLKRPPVYDGNTIRLVLTKGYEAVIDAVDEPLAHFNWMAHVSGDRFVYAARRLSVSGKRAFLFLHNAVAERAGFDLSGKTVDHKDGSGLNNRRSNLRPATAAENARNCCQKKSVSGLRGVRWDHRSDRWYAEIVFDGKYIHLGTFRSAQEAQAARIEAEVRLFGKFSPLLCRAGAGSI